MVNTRNKVETLRSRAERNLANAFLDCLEAQIGLKQDGKTGFGTQNLKRASLRLEAARRQVQNLFSKEKT